jgi:hypothetical protein
MFLKIAKIITRKSEISGNLRRFKTFIKRTLNLKRGILSDFMLFLSVFEGSF